MNKFWIATLGSMMVALAPVGAAAQAAPVELNGDVKVDKVVVENGQEKHVLLAPDATSVVPGDKLVFATRYRNNGGAEVKNFVVTNPLPAGVMLAPEGAGSLDVSVDGGKTYGKLAVLKVKGQDGQVRAAQAGDVTHIRWVLPVLAPGATGTLSYNAIVR